MGYLALLGCTCIMAAFTLPLIILGLRRHKRRALLAAVEKTEGLRHERFRLEGEAHRLLNVLEQELPDAYRDPNAGLAPTSPEGLILTERARQSLQRRGEILHRIEAIDREIKTILGDEPIASD